MARDRICQEIWAAQRGYCSLDVYDWAQFQCVNGRFGLHDRLQMRKVYKVLAGNS